MRSRGTQAARERRVRYSLLALLAATSVIAASLALPASGLTTNQVMLDDGTCSHNMQLGTDINASSSNLPWFFLEGDGGLAKYQVNIDNVSIGQFNSDAYGRVCPHATNPLSDGAHRLTATELAPNTSKTVTPYSFTVDTVAPPAPGKPALDPSSDSAPIGDGYTTYTSLRMTGTGTPGLPVHVLESGMIRGGSVSDSTGHWALTTLSMSGGAHTLTADQMDSAGNHSALSVSTTITIGTAPTATTTSTSTTTTTVRATTTTTTIRPTTTTTATTTTTTTTVPTLLPPLRPPTGLIAASGGTSGMWVTWTPPQPTSGSIYGYAVYRGTAPGAETGYALIGNFPLWIDPTVTAGVRYYYRLAAVDVSGVGQLSAEVSAVA
jgi:hypothetical protein